MSLLEKAFAEGSYYDLDSVEQEAVLDGLGALDFVSLDPRARETFTKVEALTKKGMNKSEAFKQLESLSSHYPDDPLFKMGAVRISLDGSMPLRGRLT